MATEVKEELVLIAKRRPPGDSWALLSDPTYSVSFINRSIRRLLSRNSTTM
jgi:hypothetical protein